MIDLWVRNKYTGEVHKVGDDPYDNLRVDLNGTVHYYHSLYGDGCIGMDSLDNSTLEECFPGVNWGTKAKQFVYGFEFVPNSDGYGKPFDPTKETDNE